MNKPGRMKKYILFWGVVILSLPGGPAPLVAQQEEERKIPLDWYNASLDTEGVFGAEIDRAYRLLQGMPVKKKPVVAILTTGMDTEHEALRENIWHHPKDDLYGWNFLGGSNGENMELTMQEGDREFLRLKEHYADYIATGSRFIKYIDGVQTEVPPPADRDEYRYFREQVLPESVIGKAYGGWQLAYLLRDYAIRFDRELKAKFPEKSAFGKADFGSLWNANEPDTLQGMAMTLMRYAFSFLRTDDWNQVYENFSGSRQIESARISYEAELARWGDDRRREIVGDDPQDIRDRGYGNSTLLTAYSQAGTMAAGIIAGKRNVAGRNNPVAEEAGIMTLVVQASRGEPYLKDLALALRYAVDAGADIVLFPQQNTLYPPRQRKWVADALRYAEKKGVLVIVPAWELSQDLSKTVFYPNRWMAKGKELGNLMVVSASDAAGNPVLNSNYGALEVDLYAPGVELLSTDVGDLYQVGSGAVLAAATVAGVAALIKTYFPSLSASRIRNLLIETVTLRKDVEVEKEILVGGKRAVDLFLFEQLTLSGGILNAYHAVLKAREEVKR